MFVPFRRFRDSTSSDTHYTLYQIIFYTLCGKISKILGNKKVLLRERKRHTARRVAIAIFCYLREGGVRRQKIVSPVWTCIKPNLVSKIFPLLGGGGKSLDKNFFPQSEHVSSQIWCQKFFPLLGRGGGSLTKIFFPSLNIYQAKSGVKNFSLYWEGGPSTKIFFPQSEHVSSQIWCQKFFPLLRPGTPPWKIWDLGPPSPLPRKSET